MLPLSILSKRAVTRVLIGGPIFIYSCFARQISFKIDEFEFDLERSLKAEHDYLNIHPPCQLTFQLWSC